MMREKIGGRGEGKQESPGKARKILGPKGWHEQGAKPVLDNKFGKCQLSYHETHA
jgi:hypothetical protein